MTSKPTTSQLIADMNVQIALVHAQNAEKDDARLEQLTDLDAEITLRQEEYKTALPPCDAVSCLNGRYSIKEGS